MNLTRIRSLVIWATASLALLSIIYAPKERLIWSDSAHAWQRGQLQGVPKTQGRRDFIWIIQHEACLQCSYYTYKMVPDWSRIAGELILIVGIGGGLVFCLREKPR